MADEITREADRKNNNSKQEATKISGQPDCVAQTPKAATNTAIFDAISLREHSQTELILMSSARCRQSKNGQIPFAIKPSKLNAP
jgi:hypothetical protein